MGQSVENICIMNYIIFTQINISSIAKIFLKFEDLESSCMTFWYHILSVVKPVQPAEILFSN